MFIPDLVSKRTDESPSRLFWIYAIPEDNKVVTVTQLEFARATHRAATLLRPDSQSPNGQVVAIVAQSDTILAHALLVGLMTANLIPFPISPRNSLAGIFQLLRASSCHRIVATCVTLAPVLAGLKEHISQVDPDYVLDIEEAPSVAQIYPNLGLETANSPFEPYPFATSSSSPDDIELYLHSSGSTGLPRAIGQTHRGLEQWCNLPIIADAHWIDSSGEPVGNMALPPFHLFGIVCQLLHPLHGLCVAVYPPIATSTNSLPMMPSPDNILQHSRATNCRSLTTVPALLGAWINFPESVAYLASLDFVVWGGGPLPQRIGDSLVEQGVNLRSVYGATETGTIADIRLDKQDEKEWAWFQFSEKVKVRMVPNTPNIFELQILSSEAHVPAIENLDDVKGYATSDLCMQHPKKPHLWKIVGRVDDTIIHSSGEKTVPGPMENIIISAPMVAEVVMFGRERPQAGILIELRPSAQINVGDPKQLAALRNKIWPTIQQANAIAPGFSRIFKEMVLFTSSDKPLPRSGKGSVMRTAAISMYAAEIDSLYAVVGQQLVGNVDSIAPPTTWDCETVQLWLLNLAKRVSNTSAIAPSVDLRQQGFDSLTSTVFRLHILKALRSGEGSAFAQDISQNLVYDYPTVSELTAYLVALVSGTEYNPAKRHEVDSSGTIPTLDPIVEICSGEGIPLIAFPGVTGRINNALALRSHFTGTLWALQVTDATPTSSLTAQAQFFADKIQEKRPKGPYRISTYSGMSVLGTAVVKVLEDAGHEILQLTYIEGFPMMWATEETERSLRLGGSTSQVADNVMQSVTDLFRYDPAFGPDSAPIKEWEAALADPAKASPVTQATVSQMRNVVIDALVRFLGEFYPKGEERTRDGFVRSLANWVSSVKAPITLITAEFGLVATLPPAVKERWSDLGAHLCSKPLVKHHVVPGTGHYGILAYNQTAMLLQELGS